MGSWCREQIGDEFRAGGGHIPLPLAFSLPRRGPSQLLGVYPTAKARQAPSADSCPGCPAARGWAMLSCHWACTCLPALLRWYVLPLIFLRDFSFHDLPWTPTWDESSCSLCPLQLWRLSEIEPSRVCARAGGIAWWVHGTGISTVFLGIQNTSAYNLIWSSQ